MPYMYPSKMDNNLEFQWINVEYNDETYTQYFGSNTTLKLTAKYTNQDPDDLRIVFKGDNKFQHINMGVDSDKLLFMDGTLTLGIDRDSSRSTMYDPIFENVSVKVLHELNLHVDGNKMMHINSVEILQSQESYDRFYLTNTRGGITIDNLIIHPSLDGKNKYSVLSIYDDSASFSDITIHQGEGFIYMNMSENSQTINHNINVNNFIAQQQVYGSTVGYYAGNEAMFINYCEAININDTEGNTIIQYCED